MAKATNTYPTKNYVTKREKREIVELVGDSGFVLYDHYCRGGFTNVESLSDDKIGRAINWTATKVGKYRRALEKAGIVRFEKRTVKDSSWIKLVLGRDFVALYDAGLDESFKNYDIYEQAKAHLGIEHPDDVVSRLEEIRQQMTLIESQK